LKKKALLYLEDGSKFEGYSFGATGEKVGEVVFNTGMTGYQEILTDPSYKGQIVLLTSSQIGNYGINPNDCESEKIYSEGFIVKEYFDYYSNYEANQSLGDFLTAQNIPGIEGIDTRKLTRLLRDGGSKIGVLTTENFDESYLRKKINEFGSMNGKNMVETLDRDLSEVFSAETGKYKVAMIDAGCKLNILNELKNRDCQIKIFDYDAKKEEIDQFAPDGVFVSNGPGDPAPVEPAIQLIKSLIGNYPMAGICLGHQLIGLASGAKTVKLKFGHHGINHPVKRLRDGYVEITSQNHNFAIDPDSLDADKIEITHINLNDQTVEGIKYKDYPIFSVQYHPEAAPGPNDSKYIFDDFIKLMEK